MNNRSETQQRILDAAIKYFGSKGYHGTATSEVAKEANVAQGTIFKYYKTKKDLLRGVLEHIVRDIIPSIMHQSFDEILKQCQEGDPKEVIKQLLLQKAENISQNINCIKIMAMEVHYHDDIREEYFGCVVPSFIEFLEGVYSKGVSKGVFRNINPRTAARSFASMFVFLVMDKNLIFTHLNMSSELDSIIDLYLNGVCNKKEGEQC